MVDSSVELDVSFSASHVRYVNRQLSGILRLSSPETDIETTALKQNYSSGDFCSLHLNVPYECLVFCWYLLHLIHFTL
ncbi:hypothetical protein SERLADRAFT_475889 [Serpula lacrymans var. lacrymans S7.9]|uniref:Uncharacterized protein n=1 Tax=Serpula lacrymans var. lacrymans (strain S7.9) TaxID=578457 RepID=F8P6R0_SERL9|nr:uncharacterized protein SERLADRAFT_475889 [Serpula lacrymans var. lacrymans S7.9]EGO21126.1 hypothetical protein SERLADRAFT_475889 [Serpula lacrymans var. lacrymans S7.9]